MAVLKLKYIHGFKDRHGKQRYYFRRRGFKQVPLRGEVGSAEFMADYQTALSGEVGGRRPIGKDKILPGSVSAAIVGYLTSAEYLGLADATKPKRRRALERFREKYGDMPVRSLQTQHLRQMMAEKADTPTASNYVIQVVRWIVQYAIDQGWRKDDPTIGLKKIRVKSEGYHSWSEEEIRQFEQRWPVGATRRLAFDLLLHTGQRSGDVRKMNRSQIVGGMITLRQSKTGARVQIPITPELQSSINTIPSNQLLLVVNRDGVGFSEKGFSNMLSDAAQTAGLPKGCSAHGLRKAAAVRLAEAGCTSHEIMAITGHKTLQEVNRYTQAANAGRLAKVAMAKLATARGTPDYDD
ncbi:MAG TPA: tyrosine-type recombinase/integrase [Caulobacteraceae bacterium]|jgi:integrase|nr:tyrosine-type recombinase/integrase [Caulobacteraceae bacterium]